MEHVFAGYQHGRSQILLVSVPIASLMDANLALGALTFVIYVKIVMLLYKTENANVLEINH